MPLLLIRCFEQVVNFGSRRRPGLEVSQLVIACTDIRKVLYRK